MHKISFAQDLLQQIMTARRNHINAKINIYELELGPFFLPNDSTTLTNLLLYWILLLARPVFFFFFSTASTLGVWPLTLPARAREPWTLPPRSGMLTSTGIPSRRETLIPSWSRVPAQVRFSCSAETPSSWES